LIKKHCKNFEHSHRALADGYGMTVEETISTAMDQFVAGCVAEQEAEKNIIPFPRPHPTLSSRRRTSTSWNPKER